MTERPPSEQSLSPQDAQCALFGHYESIFMALTGAPSSDIASEGEMIERLGKFNAAVADEVNASMGELEHFYKANSTAMYRAAKSFGGLRVVSGGQRHFGPSALAGTRIAGLYCDTQLIPDPVYPFLVSDLRLNAPQLQLAIVLFHILQLRPLVDARLPEAPIFVFPSFEQPLEAKDAVTQAVASRPSL